MDASFGCRCESAPGVQERHKPDAVAAGRAVSAGRGQGGSDVDVRGRRHEFAANGTGLLLAERRNGQHPIPRVFQGQ